MLMAILLGGVVISAALLYPPEPAAGLGARLRAHVAALASAGGTGSRVVFTEGNRRGVAYVLDQMRRDVPSAYADTFLVRRAGMREPAPLANAVAVLPGESDSLLVICAHIDASGSRDAGWSRGWASAKAPGADDDATGIAAMLEVLTLVAHAPRKPHYTLMFIACNAEEKNPTYAGHHLGSRHAAEALRAARKPVRGVIAMDMVGWNPRELYMPIFSSSRSAWLSRALLEHGRWLGLPLALAGEGPCPNSDNDSFDRAGFPAVLLMESCKPWRSEGRHLRNPTYHTSRDLPSVVDYRMVEYVTKLVASYAVR
jgi:hypothetical protein